MDNSIICDIIRAKFDNKILFHCEHGFVCVYSSVRDSIHYSRPCYILLHDDVAVISQPRGFVRDRLSLFDPDFVDKLEDTIIILIGKC